MLVSPMHAEMEAQEHRDAIPDPISKTVQMALHGDLHEKWTAFRKAKFLKEYHPHVKLTPEIRKMLRRVKPKASMWHVCYVLRDWCPTPEDQASKDCPRFWLPGFPSSAHSTPGTWGRCIEVRLQSPAPGGLEVWAIPHLG